MLEKTRQRFAAVDVNCIFIVCFTINIPTKNICETFHSPPTYSGLSIEAWFCQMSTRRHTDIAIHHGTSVHSTCLAAKDQNSSVHSL